jgi:hypothetical protein
MRTFPPSNCFDKFICLCSILRWNSQFWGCAIFKNIKSKAVPVPLHAMELLEGEEV